MSPVVPTGYYPYNTRWDNGAPSRVGGSDFGGWIQVVAGDVVAPAPWQPTTSYSVENQVYAGLHTYQCTQGGISAALAGDFTGQPTGTGSGIVDNTVVWNYVGELAPFSAHVPWQSAHAYSIGTIVSNETAAWLCVTAGTSSGSGPTFATNHNKLPGTVFHEGTVDWRYLGILADFAEYAQIVNAANSASVIAVASVSAARLTPGVLGATLITQGYTIAGDDGGGQWYWDASSVIADDGILSINPSGASAGRWLRDFSGMNELSALSCGADRTGTTDSTTALQACINTSLLNAINAYVPAGFYKISAPLTIGFVPGRTPLGASPVHIGFELYGDGIGYPSAGPTAQINNGTTIFVDQSITGYASLTSLIISRQDNWRRTDIHDMTLYGNTSLPQVTNFAVLFDGSNCTAHSIRRMYVYGTDFVGGILTGNSSGFNGEFFWWHEITSHTNRGFLYHAASQAYVHRIEHCGGLLAVAPVGTPVTAWAQNTVFNSGTKVANGGNVYMCVQGGTSAASGAGPTTKAQVINDNQCVWNFSDDQTAIHFDLNWTNGSGGLICTDYSASILGLGGTGAAVNSIYCRNRANTSPVSFYGGRCEGLTQILQMLPSSGTSSFDPLGDVVSFKLCEFTIANPQVVPAWAVNNFYYFNPGPTFVLNGGNVYQLTTAGRAASSGAGPTGTGSGIVDNTCVWRFVQTLVVGQTFTNTLGAAVAVDSVNSLITFEGCRFEGFANDRWLGVFSIRLTNYFGQMRFGQCSFHGWSRMPYLETDAGNTQGEFFSLDFDGCLCDSSDLQQYSSSPWFPNTQYATGAKVSITSQNCYVATVGGISAVQPAGTTLGANITDGTITWNFIRVFDERIQPFELHYMTDQNLNAKRRDYDVNANASTGLPKNLIAVPQVRKANGTNVQPDSPWVLASLTGAGVTIDVQDWNGSPQSKSDSPFSRYINLKANCSLYQDVFDLSSVPTPFNPHRSIACHHITWQAKFEQIPQTSLLFTLEDSSTGNVYAQFDLIQDQTTSANSTASERSRLITLSADIPQSPPAWVTGTVYVGNSSYVLSNGNLYKCTTGGTSGATPPAGLGAGISDGTCVWFGICAQTTSFLRVRIQNQGATGAMYLDWQFATNMPAGAFADSTYGPVSNLERWDMNAPRVRAFARMQMPLVSDNYLLTTTNAARDLQAGDFYASLGVEKVRTYSQGVWWTSERIAEGAAIPTSGQWPFGTKVRNTTITPAGTEGWVQITAGDVASLAPSMNATQWAINTAYALRAWVYNGVNVYVCVVAGTSAGSGGPTGTGSNIADNTAKWTFWGTLAPTANATAWIVLTAYTVGNQINNGGNVYQCTGSGTSAASSGPSGTTSGISDGSVIWTYIGPLAVWKTYGIIGS